MSDRPAKRPALGWVAVALVLGMLIWVRLRLVTDIPRSAYAEPQGREQPDGEPTPSSNERPRGTDDAGRVAEGVQARDAG